MHSRNNVAHRRPTSANKFDASKSWSPMQTCACGMYNVETTAVSKCENSASKCFKLDEERFGQRTSQSLTALKVENISLKEHVKFLENHLCDFKAVRRENSDLNEKLHASAEESLRVREKYIEMSERVRRFMENEKAVRVDLESKLSTQEHFKKEVVRLSMHLDSSHDEITKLKLLNASCIDRMIHERTLNDVKAENAKLRLALLDSVPRTIHKQVASTVCMNIRVCAVKTRGDCTRLRKYVQHELTTFSIYFFDQIHKMKNACMKDINDRCMELFKNLEYQQDQHKLLKLENDSLSNKVLETEYQIRVLRRNMKNGDTFLHELQKSVESAEQNLRLSRPNRLNESMTFK